MFMTGDVTTVDEEHLVALVEARYADVSGRAGSDAGHDDGHALVTAALQIVKHMYQWRTAAAALGQVTVTREHA